MMIGRSATPQYKWHSRCRQGLKSTYRRDSRLVSWLGTRQLALAGSLLFRCCLERLASPFRDNPFGLKLHCLGRCFGLDRGVVDITVVI